MNPLSDDPRHSQDRTSDAARNDLFQHSDRTLDSSSETSAHEVSVSSELSIALPTSIGHYKIISLIGEGGMGTVYEAEQDRPRRTVALKVIRPGYATPSHLRRFEQEAQALGRLQHLGIAQIYEAGTAETNLGPQPFFAMEYVRGKRLLDYAASAHLGIRQRLDLAAKIADAVQHAHERGIIHRDLKPGNILVNEEGQPKVLDFGVARVTDSDFQATRQTDIGQLIGTIPYMSPEQISADPEALDTRSDVYALGVIVYELLAGRLPYDLRNKSLADSARVIREDDPTPLSSINRSYRGDIETIIGKSLEKEKARRYASASELASDIRRYLSDEPIVARPPSATYQVSKFARRNRILVGGIAAVILVLAAGATASTILAIRATRAQKLAEDRRVQTEQSRALAVARENEAEAARRLAEQRQLEAEASRKAADKARIAEATQRQEAERSAEQAKQEKARAEHNLDLAKDSVEKYFIQVSLSPELKTQNLEKLRRNLLVTAQQFYQQFVNEKSDDGYVKADFGRALSTLGAIDVSMGENKQALEVLEHARAILEASWKQHPENLIIGRNLFLTYQQLGQLYENTGAYPQAETLDREAISIGQNLSDAHLGGVQEILDLGDATENLGKLLTRLNRVDEAIAYTKKGMELREGLMKKYPDKEEYANSLLASDVNMVSALAGIGKIKEALPYAEQAAEIGERTFASHPEDPDAAFRLGASYNNLGGVYRLLGREAESVKAHRRALEIREKLAREHPTVVDYNLALSGSYINLGELAESDGNPKDAVDWLSKAEQTLRGILGQEPKQATARYFLSYDYSWQARAFEDLGKQDEASKCWSLAIEYDDHNDPQLKLSRAMALAHKGEYEKAGAQADELAKQEKLPETLYRLAGVYVLSASAARAANNPSLADSYLGKAFELLGRATEAGYFKDSSHVEKLDKDTSFDGLRSAEKFRKFRSQLGVTK